LALDGEKEKMEKEVTLQDIPRRLAALKTTVASLTAERKPDTRIDFPHIGGKKVGHPVPVKTEQPIDFSSVKGRCLCKDSEHPLAKATKYAGVGLMMNPKQTAIGTLNKNPKR